MNNNDTPKESGDRGMKTFAIVGLVIVMILLVWAAIQIVQLVPNAFSSLASLADSVYNRQDEVSLEVSSTDSTVDSEKSTELRWTDLRSEGTYTFSYECAPGISVDVETQTGTFEQITCDTPYTLPSGVFNSNVRFKSDRERFSDVLYSISFTPVNDGGESQQITKTITVVNPALARDNGSQPVNEEPAMEPVTPDPAPVNEPGQPTGYRYVEIPVYVIPTSDPDGYTELIVTFLNFGILTDDNEFVPKQVLEIGERGAVQFEVKNIGTKTSDEWDFRAILPFNIRYNSKSQDSLKPNERSVVTVAFDGVYRTGVEEVDVRISGGDDKSTHNNSFSWPVVVTR